MARKLLVSGMAFCLVLMSIPGAGETVKKALVSNTLRSRFLSVMKSGKISRQRFVDRDVSQANIF
jgi:hypothetical protein